MRSRLKVIPALRPGPALEGHPYAEFLGQMQKPGRYLGGEEQAICKEWESLQCRFVLAFPDIYEIGMSHLGTRILYDLINREEDLCCERAFSPWSDMEAELRAREIPLVSLENRRPLRDFDVVGLSLQHELCYTNVLLNLDLGGVPLRNEDRGDSDPIVLGGGPTATHPEPLADFIDIFLVGEAEETLPALLRQIGVMRQKGRTRLEILAMAAKIKGIYVPRFYRVETEPRTGLQVVAGRTQEGEILGVQALVERVFVRNLDDFKFPTRFPVPFAEAIFDRASVEITRGCTEGCRFCQAGMIYRPVRERKPEDIIEAVLEGTDAGGFTDASLTALSTADVSCIDPLIRALVPELAKRKVSLGIASLRAYGLQPDMLDEIKKVGINGLTFAPEAGTQRMRDVINKNVSDEDILLSARRIFERGYGRMKMYFMMGLPTETQEDLQGIVETGRNVSKVARDLKLPRPPQITVSVSQHVPKPHTPFQWAAMDTVESLEAKVEFLRESTRKTKLGLKTHAIRESWLECIFARGDRRLGRALELAYREGARFDGWREGFSYPRWKQAFADADIDCGLYTGTFPLDIPLPWSHLDMGFEDGFLEGEYRRALKGRNSPPCGKPAGMQVHHSDEKTAQADARRLVCYDCGIACDLSEMRDDRLVALRTLDSERSRFRKTPDALPAEQVDEDVENNDDAFARGERVAHSVLPDDSAFKENAEAAYSKVRIFFAKRDNLVFLGHLDIVRMVPRMFRRAGIEMGFSRGFKPQPRMSMGPALALGMAGEEEVMECDLILERSHEDINQRLTEGERAEMSTELFMSVRKCAPPGLEILGVRIVAPGEMRLGEMVAGADFSAAVRPERVAGLEQRIEEIMQKTELVVERDRRIKKGKGRRRGEIERVSIDIRPFLVDIRFDAEASRLHFRVQSDRVGPSPRPREIARIFLGDGVPDIDLRRDRLLARDEENRLCGLRKRGARWRPAHRRHPPRTEESAAPALS